MKRILFTGIVLVFFLSIIAPSNGSIKGVQEVSIMEAETIVKGFEASEATFSEMNINSTLHLPDKFINIEEMVALKETLINVLNISGKKKFVLEPQHYDPYFMIEDNLKEDTIYIYINEEEGYNQVTVTAVDMDGSITVLIIYSTEMLNQKESYIIIDMVHNKGYKEIGAIIQQHKEVLLQFGDAIETNITLVGTLEGSINKDDKEEWLSSIAKAIDAEKVESVSDDNYISITLFSKDLSNTIQYGNNKVNLQMASRYNQYEDKTYLWIATPLITNTY